MNILLTSVGRRTYIVNYFKEALQGLGKIHVSNSTPLSSAFCNADEYVVSPLIYSDEYIPFLLSYAKEYNITHIISLFDADLPVLAHNKKLFESNGIYVLVSEEKTIQICNDKWETYLFLLDNGFDTPHTYVSLIEAKEDLKRKKIAFPLILKPRWGMGSIGLYECKTIQELEFFYEYIHNIIQSTYLKYENHQDILHCVLIQEKIIGDEYGLDIINDLNGQYCATISKKKLAMRSGETDIAEVGCDMLLENFGKRLAHSLKHVGNLDSDIIQFDGNNYVIDLNNRFGGGYPFSHNAGVNLPKALIHWFNNPNSDQTELLQIKNSGIYFKDIHITKQK